MIKLLFLFGFVTEAGTVNTPCIDVAYENDDHIFIFSSYLSKWWIVFVVHMYSVLCGGEQRQ